MVSTARAEEVVVPLRANRNGLVDPVTHMRSTLISASLLAIKERGYFEAYAKLLPRELHDPVLNAVAGTWLDLPLVVAHYRAANEIGVGPTDLIEIGRSVARRIHDSLLGTLVKMAKNIGVTPWIGLEYQPKLWARVCMGGSVAVYRLGPKEARYEAHGFPDLAKIAYFRSSLRGMFIGSGELFCSRMFVQEIPSFTARGVIALRAAWA